MSRVDWLIEGLLPSGALATVADLDDPEPDELLASGLDVVLLLHDSGDQAFHSGAPILFEVRWRDGLVPGHEPPPPFWVRFDLGRGGLVRVDEPKEAA